MIDPSVLSKALHQKLSLKIIDMSDNKIDDNYMEKTKEALISCSGLKDINLANNQLQSGAHLSDVLIRNKSILVLSQNLIRFTKQYV